MSWSPKQIRLAGMACRDASIGEGRLRLLLLQFPRSIVDGRPTRTSPRLTNADFDRFMAHVEGIAGGQLLKFSRDHFLNKASGPDQRLRWKAERVLVDLDAPGGVIRRATGGKTDQLDDLSDAELRNVIDGAKAVRRRKAARPIEDRPEALTHEEIPF